MSPPPLKHCAAAGLALYVAAIVPAWCAPFMIVGNDEKVATDAQGKPVINPTGNDTVLIIDLAKPEDPKIIATLPLENCRNSSPARRYSQRCSR